MNLWKKASFLLKDQNSIFLANLATRSPSRNPDLETAIIKATSHDESSVDYKNAQRIFTWARTIPRSWSPLIRTITIRLEKTRHWAVALKGLILLHGIFCCKIPALRRNIGRLPFDLSNFVDGYSDNERMWEFNAFIRAYFAFLDQRSVFDACEEAECKQNDVKELSILCSLQELQRSQVLLDMLMQITPYSDRVDAILIFEAMDCVIIEIFDVYSRICNRVAGVLVQVHEASKAEGELALRVLYKAASQAAELPSYFEYCNKIGFLNATQIPYVEQIPDEDIQDLERIINGVTKPLTLDAVDVRPADEDNAKDVVIRLTEEHDARNLLRTIITDNWVAFEEESAKIFNPYEGYNTSFLFV